jgi:hypothetical protein
MSTVGRWFLGFGLVLSLAYGCLGGGENTGLPESNTFDPRVYIETGIDSFYYPEAQWFSSYRFPLARFGPDRMMDGDTKTYWSTSTGLNDGEGFDFVFEATKAKTMKIWAAEDPYLARVDAFEVWQNDSLLGRFLSGQEVIFTRPLRRLKVRIVVSDGWNQMQLPLENEDGKSQRTARTLGKLFNSRPAGISEVQLLGADGQLMPFRPKPIRTAAIRLLGVGDPLDKYFMYDEGPQGRIRGGLQGEERRVLFTFADWVPVLKLRMEKDEKEPMKVQVLPSDGPQKEFEWVANREDFYVDSLSVQKGFTLVVQPKNMEDLPFSFGQIQAWSGRRWWLILPDSLESEPERRWNHLQKTPLAAWMNQPLVYKETWANYAEILPAFVEPEDALETNPSSSFGKEIKLWLRSMGTFALRMEQWKSADAGPLKYFSLFSGRWYWSPVQPNELGLEGWYLAHSQTGRAGFSKKWLTLKVKLSDDGLRLPAPYLITFPLRR